MKIRYFPDTDTSAIETLLPITTVFQPA